MNQNFSLIRNRTYKLTCTATEGVSAVNLTGATLSLTARWSAGGDVVFTCSSPSDGIVITSPSTGVFTITIAASKTSSLPIEEGFLALPYEVLLTTTGGELYTLLYGKLVVTPNIV
jgi:hypothetical protein